MIESGPSYDRNKPQTRTRRAGHRRPPGPKYDGLPSASRTFSQAVTDGFGWWQGHKDTGNEIHAQRYEQNLVHLIKTDPWPERRDGRLYRDRG